MKPPPKYSMVAWKTVDQPALKYIRSDFKAFCMYMHEATTGTKMLWEPFHDDMANMLIDMYNGECVKGIINIPPRSGKTYIICMFMAWSMGNAPWSEFIYACYSNRLATKATADVKAFMGTPAYARLYPDLKLATDTKAKDFFKTTMGGTVYATSKGGTVTGFGAGKMQLPDGETFGGMLIVDDLLKASDRNSKIELLSANDWYEETYENRKNNRKRTPTLIIAQRLNANDVVGLVLARKNEVWRQLSVPCLFENEKGEEESFWEFKYPLEEMKIDRANNPSNFATQFQQDPTDKEGAIIKVGNFRRFDMHDQPPMEYSWIFADTALTKTQRSDPSCLEHWGYTKGSVFLLDVWHGKVDTTELEAICLDFWLKCKQNITSNLRYMAIEAKASGHQILQALPSKGIPVKQINRPNDKVTRATVAEPWIDKGHVYLPTKGQLSVVDDIMMIEATSFPNYLHDDTLEGLFDACENFLGIRDPFEGLNVSNFKIPLRTENMFDIKQYSIPNLIAEPTTMWSQLPT